MNKQLLQQSVSIFDSSEKWDALFEIYTHSNEIINHWLTIGATALRESFEGDPLWGCEVWGLERDTRWYLKENGCGKESLGIGFGWKEVELHLHLRESPAYSYNHAAELLHSPAFRPLLEIFELRTPGKYISDGGLAYNASFNPFGGAIATPVRERELAWLAAHETENYVEKMGGYIRRLTSDQGLTSIFREFNRQIRQTAESLG